MSVHLPRQAANKKENLGTFLQHLGRGKCGLLSWELKNPLFGMTCLETLAEILAT